MSAIGAASARNGATARRAASTRPAYASVAITTSRPWSWAPRNGSGGAGMTFAIVVSSSGAAWAAATKDSITSALAGRIKVPPTIVSTSLRRNWYLVATPKLPPPPRMAQNRSGCVSASTWRTSPSAVTTSAASRSSIVSPCLRTRKPTPPPSVIPPIPTDAASPNPVARPWAAAASVYSPAVSPVSAQAVRCPGSMLIPRMSERSRTMPSSQTPWPAALCPPLRTARSSPVSRASAMSRTTSSAFVGRTMSAGRRSMAPEKTVRARS